METGEVWICDATGAPYEYVGTLAEDGIAYSHEDEVRSRVWVRDPATGKMREVWPAGFFWPVGRTITLTTEGPVTRGTFEVLTGLCFKCRTPLGPCDVCSAPALCGEPWCAQCQPE